MDYQTLREEIANLSSKAKIVAATKYHTTEQLWNLYRAGCRIFAESRVQQFLERQSLFPDDLCWHFIGTLQRKKAKKIVGKVELIHSVDSLPLAEEVAKRAKGQGITQKVLCQINTSEEISKHGICPKEAVDTILQIDKLSEIEIVGLMTMATKGGNVQEIRRCFSLLSSLQKEAEKALFRSLPELSMGMSGDYKIALEEGSSLVRIGSLLRN